LHGLVEADELHSVLLQPAQGPRQLACRAAQAVVGMHSVVLDDAMQRKNDSMAAIARGDQAAEPGHMGADGDAGPDECAHAHRPCPSSSNWISGSAETREIAPAFKAIRQQPGVFL